MRWLLLSVRHKTDGSDVVRQLLTTGERPLSKSTKDGWQDDPELLKGGVSSQRGSTDLVLAADMRHPTRNYLAREFRPNAKIRRDTQGS